MAGRGSWKKPVSGELPSPPGPPPQTAQLTNGTNGPSSLGNSGAAALSSTGFAKPMADSRPNGTANTGFTASTGFGGGSGGGSSSGFGSGGSGRDGRSQNCYKCNEPGHMSRDCPNPSAGGGGRGNCYKCNQPGHMSRDCPNPSAGNGGGSGNCFKCKEPGHMSRDCPNQPAGGGGGSGNCYKCNEPGHMSRDCPNPSAGSGGGSGNCFKCKEPGHMSRDCPNQPAGGGGGSGNCFKCNEPGHMSRDCPNRPADGERCFKCNETGHISRDCPTRVGADGVEAPVRESYIPDELTVEDLCRLSVKSGENARNFDQFQVEVSGSSKLPPIKTLQEVGVPDSVLELAKKVGVTSLFPIQAYAIPIVLSGRDLMACAQTGSGKTLAYLLPLIRLLLELPKGDNTVYNGICYPKALIIVPTRELCTQVYDLCNAYFRGTGLKAQRIHGDIQHSFLAQSLHAGAHVLVATCGRLKDFMRRNIISLARTKHIVLDEADRMLDQGFQEDVVHFLQSADKTRQVVMFSATYPPEVQTLAQSYLAQDYLFLSVGRIGAPNPDVSQEVREVEQSDKVQTLLALLTEFQGQSPNGFGERKVLVFVERKETANMIGLLLCQNGFQATNNHGDRPPKERQRAFADFRVGDTPVMVTTNVLARGVDISGIALVVNYDLPQDDVTYVHRIGRTGRCGNLGRSISFFDPNVDGPAAPKLVSNLQDAQQPVPEWLEALAERQVGGGYSVGGGGRGGRRDIRRGVSRIVDMLHPVDGGGDNGANGECSFQPRSATIPAEDDWS